jgi:hypothetical protein
MWHHYEMNEYCIVSIWVYFILNDPLYAYKISPSISWQIYGWPSSSLIVPGNDHTFSLIQMFSKMRQQYSEVCRRVTEFRLQSNRLYRIPLWKGMEETKACGMVF